MALKSLLAVLPLVLAQTGLNSTTYPDAVEAYTGTAALLNNAFSPPHYPSPWGEGLGDWEQAYAQARTFVSSLTLLEKVNLTTGVGWEAEKCVGNVGSIPRLGFRALCMQDSPLGIRFADFVSAFTAGTTIAATWDRRLMYQRGFDMGNEHQQKGVDVVLGPVVGPLGRHPEGGRNWEGFSPDPVLSAVAVEQSVKGIQAAGVMACTKHYILNEQEHYRQGPPPGYLTAAISSNIDDITMHELYLWPFAEAVKAGSASIMCSYNQINNSYGCQNSYTQNYLLKNELGFQGFIMSDWTAHHSGVASALAGMDMSMPGDVNFDTSTSYWGSNLTISVLNGSVPEWRMDDMAIRIVAGWYYVDRESYQVPDAPNFSSWTKDTLGWQHFYAQEDYRQVNDHVVVTGDHGANIRTQAAAGTVLLKNTGSLPLTGTEKLTTVFGSDAGENPYGPNGCADRGCDQGTLAMGWGSGTADFPYLITPLEAIKSRVIQNGSGFVEGITDDYAYSQITALARRAQQVNGVCIAFINSDAGEGYITVDGNEGDRNNLTAWHAGNTLISTVTSQCNNTVVVIHSVGPILVDSFNDNPNVTAIVWAGLPGQASGFAIADILYGDVNPGGKSPFTWGRRREDYGTDVLYSPNNGVNAPQDNFEEGIFIDYRAFDRAGIDPIYEFGYGLSYTTFEYSNLQVTTRNASSAYAPASGDSDAAGTYGSISNRTADYLCPPGFHFVTAYIYPCLNSTDLATAGNDPQYGLNHTYPDGAYDSSPQPRVPAGGAPGGNPLLWDVLFTVSATISNTGGVVGDEVPQLYVSLGGPNDAAVALRNFDRITIQPGASVTWSADLTFKDLANWSPASQDWYISSYTKTAYVGSSARKLPLSAVLNVAGTSPGNGGSGNSTTSSSSYTSSTSSGTSSSSTSSSGSSGSTTTTTSPGGSTSPTTSPGSPTTTSTTTTTLTSTSSASSSSSTTSPGGYGRPTTSPPGYGQPPSYRPRPSQPYTPRSYTA